MSHILCVWELGGGLGHLTALKPFVDAALARGHRVSLALRESRNLPLLLPGFRGGLYRAPYLSRTGASGEALLSYSQLMLQRFDSGRELSQLLQGWDRLFAACRPDLVVYNFAPTALIASLHRPWQKWVAGTGFEIPRRDLPWFGLFPRVRNTPDNAAKLDGAQDRLLALINGQLATRALPAIDSPDALFDQADRELLLTLPEVDHFGARPGGTYLGIPGPAEGRAPCWSGSAGPRVFAYLAPFVGIEDLLAELQQRGARLLVYAPELPPGLHARFPEIHFSDRPLDIAGTLASADLAVTMGGHHTGVQCLLAGVPQLMVPRRQEQYYFARRVAAAGRGVLLRPRGGDVAGRVTEALDLAAAGPRPPAREYAAAMGGQLLDGTLKALFDALAPGAG